MHTPDSTLSKVIDDCHELLKWRIPLSDKFLRQRRFTLANAGYSCTPAPAQTSPSRPGNAINARKSENVIEKPLKV